MPNQATSVLSQLQGQLQGNSNAVGGNTLAAPRSASAGPSNTAQIQNILNAKGGKAGGGGAAAGAPQQSNLAELQAKAQTKAQLEQGAKQGQLQEMQIQQAAAGQEQEQQQQLQVFNEKELDMASQAAMRAQSVLAQFSEGQQQLDLKKYGARLEQVGFNARMSNEKYIQQLRTEGAKSRLFDKSRFDEEITKSIFSDEEQLLTNDLHFKAIIRQEGREFSESISSLGIDWAIQMAGQENKEANAKQMMAGGQGILNAGINTVVNKMPTVDTNVNMFASSADSTNTGGSSKGTPGSLRDNSSTGAPSTGNVLKDSGY